MISVAIISPKLSLDPINNVIETHDFGCEFHKYVYGKLSDIEWIYEDCKDSCDVIFFSGELGYHYILNHIENIRIPCAFTAYGTRDILAILLQFVIEHPTIPLSRIHADFLTPLNDFMQIKQYIPSEYLPYFYESAGYDYDLLTARAKELWDSGKIDIVLTRSINNIPMFKKLGIPYYAIFPTERMITESIEGAINDLRLARDAEGEQVTVIIRLPYEKECDADEREYRIASMHKLLVDFRRESGLTFSITSGFDRFELQRTQLLETDTSAIPQEMVLYLKEHVDFDFRCGCGVSKSEDKSHYYAETALLEALKYGSNDGFLVGGEDAVLTGPLSVSNHLTYQYDNDKAISLAKQIGIDKSNLIRLIGLFRLNEETPLTAASVSKLLNITTRSGNRILQQLLETQLIREVSASVTNRKGRPVREYRFLPKKFQELLL